MAMADDAEARLAKTNMEKLARSQLTISYKNVDPLKDSTYHQLKEQIDRVAWGDDWPLQILDVTIESGYCSISPTEKCHLAVERFVSKNYCEHCVEYLELLFNCPLPRNA